MDTLTFISNSIDSLAWPLFFAFVLYLFKEPFSVVIQSLKRLKYKDLEIELEESDETGNAEVDLLISHLLDKSHSFKWLRNNTALTQTDEEFETIISENPSLFKAIKIRRFKDGQRVQPGNPGVKYIGKK